MMPYFGLCFISDRETKEANFYFIFTRHTNARNIQHIDTCILILFYAVLFILCIGPSFHFPSRNLWNFVNNSIRKVLLHY